jgi:hypothetical protein
MSEKPILFSGPMIRAILAGEKTQTRRVLKSQPMVDCAVHKLEGNEVWFETAIFGGHTMFTSRTLPYRDGDLLWVREAWRKLFCHEELPCLDCQACRQAVAYKADEPNPQNYTLSGGYRREELWRPSIHMPRWASRITLKVTAVKVERLRDIYEPDCLAEGTCGRVAFRMLWDSINGKKHPWESNPWVVAVTFERVEAGR